MAKKTDDLILKSIENSAVQTDAAVGAGTDVTKQKQAKNKEQVDSQDARTRIWQSLNTTYGQRTDQSNQQYDLNRNAADRAALQRGMGRSSYNLQTMANIDTEKAKAADRIQQELIADYQSRLGALEQQEQAQKNWEAEFNFQKEGQQKQIAIQYINNMLQNGGTPSDELLKQAGLSRKDYDQMKKKQSGGGGYPKKPTTTGDQSGNGNNGLMTAEEFYAKYFGYGKGSDNDGNIIQEDKGGKLKEKNVY